MRHERCETGDFKCLDVQFGSNDALGTHIDEVNV